MNKDQKKFLRSLAHELNPVIWIGPQGLSENVISEIKTALDHHELIKIRIRTGDRERRDQIIDGICRLTDTVLVQRIGNIISIYKRHPEKPKIVLSTEDS